MRQDSREKLKEEMVVDEGEPMLDGEEDEGGTRRRISSGGFTVGTTTERSSLALSTEGFGDGEEGTNEHTRHPSSKRPEDVE